MRKAMTPFEREVATILLARGWEREEVEKILRLAPGMLGPKKRSGAKGARVHEDHSDR